MPLLESLQMNVPTDGLELILLLAGWVVAFLLGQELSKGFSQWRTRTREVESRRRD